MSGRTTRLPADACPYCGHPLDAASSRDPQARPSPGDETLCIECGEWLVFGDELRLRKPSDDELVKIGLDPDAQLVRRAWRNLIL